MTTAKVTYHFEMFGIEYRASFDQILNYRNAHLDHNRPFTIIERHDGAIYSTTTYNPTTYDAAEYITVTYA